MKKFEFRFETILKVKRLKVERCQKELAMVLQEVKESQKRQEILKSHFDSALVQLLNMDKKHVDVASHLRFEAYFRKIKKDLADEQRVLDALARKEEQARESLLKAVKERKTYEKLKEKSKESYDQFVRRQEMEWIDEIATMRGKGVFANH